MSDNTSAPGSAGNPVKFKSQDYTSIRDECLKTKTLFLDSTFTADQTSIGMPADPDPKLVIKWLRPKEISSNAVFVEGTTGTTDICQGQLGNCWLLASLSCLTMHPTLFEKVVPAGQTLAAPYAGIFLFRFWQYGEWVEVVVDDRLPVQGGRLLFSYSRTSNEFWSALVEKAYAKLIGSYGSLKGGNISEGMEDFTGGIAYTRPVSSRTPPVLWRTLTAALSRGSLLSCFIQAKNVKEIGTVTAEGLVKGHAYAITATDKVHRKAEEVLLVRLRNPWGFVEFCGPWSDKCKDWDGIDSAEKTRIHLNIEEDGEFWIGVEDFCRMFDTVELCSVNPDSDAGEDGDAAGASDWSLTSHKGSWVPMCSAGGSRKYPRTFWKNPQFHLVLSQQDVEDVEVDEDDADVGDDDNDAGDAARKSGTEKHKEKMKKCTVLVELLQKDRRQKDKINFFYIAFHIFKVPPELQDRTGSFDQQFFSANPLVSRSGPYKNARAVWRKVHLDPGHYVILPSTQRPNQQGEFFLRIYAKKGNTLGLRDITCPTPFNMTVMSKPPLPEDQKRVEKWFDKEAGPDDRLNALEFMKLVNTVLEKDYHLPLETCRQLIFGEDTGRRGRLSRDQAEKLLSSLRNLQSIFFKYDEDSSGTMNPFELSQALKAAGVQCDNCILQMLWERFGSGEQHLPFPSFVSCVTRLQVLVALFESESSLEVKNRGITAWLLRLLAV
ncbi:calpain-12 [Colossoma macropomum]|uniref:calpain-12 n=1 Tax=Colossoma macropomum TaxID=42526 RepID=UPI00186553D4|nr:calpain-12 [Colossoma macropomum]